MEKKRPWPPTLLERLLDEEPKKQQESYDAFFFTADNLRAVVQKEIGCLLNNTNIEEQLDENRHPQVIESVVNYGVAPLVGKYANHHNWTLIEKNIRNALLRFEPRIVPESLLVRPLTTKEHPGNNGLVLFEIRGLIYWQPHPIDLCISGAYDAETAKVDLKSS